MSKVNVKVTVSQAALRQVARETERRIEEGIRKVVERVRREMAGQPEEDVFQRLVREMRTSLKATVTQDDPRFRKYAAEIAADGSAE